MLYRQLGKTGREVSVIGLGGFHIGKQKDPAESIRLIHAALDHGITFLDNCWDYNEGQSEIRMGQALKGRRDKVFLMTKIDGRTAIEAERQINQSLSRLQTDHVDLLQFHEVIRMEDPDRVFAPNGAVHAVLKAQQAGKVRHIGFTGHKDPLIHGRMLDVAAAHGFHFDTVQMPVNIMDARFRSFQEAILPRLAKQGTAALAMKTFGDPHIWEYIQRSGTAKPIELLHYGMSQPVAVVITGIDGLPILEQALEAVRTFKPMSAAQCKALLEKTRVAEGKGKYEIYKTGTDFDSTAKHPEFLG